MYTVCHFHWWREGWENENYEYERLHNLNHMNDIFQTIWWILMGVYDSALCLFARQIHNWLITNNYYLLRPEYGLLVASCFFCVQNYYFFYLVFSFRTGWCDFIIWKYTVEELLTDNLPAASYCAFCNTKFAPWSSWQYTIILYEIEIEKERHLMSFRRKYKYMTTVI